MSSTYDSHGRVGQKRRTRSALIAAARELVTRGEAPTVEEAASLASVSRTTAYRYFPNQGALLSAAHPEVDASSLLPSTADAADPSARLDAVVATFTALIVDTEAQQRTMLRLSLSEPSTASDSLPLRQGRAIGWITEALEPLRVELGDAGLRRLVLAIRSAIGIEALVWLTDIAGLSRPDAVELMTWSARAMLKSALDGLPPA